MKSGERRSCLQRPPQARLSLLTCLHDRRQKRVRECAGETGKFIERAVEIEKKSERVRFVERENGIGMVNAKRTEEEDRKEES